MTSEARGRRRRRAAELDGIWRRSLGRAVLAGLTEPRVAEERAARYAFTPYTVRPRCGTGCSGEAIVAHIPPLARRMGVSCAMKVGIRIDTAGRVIATDILEASGNAICDRAILEWARETEWTTAYNRDQPVVVWIAQPVTLVAVAEGEAGL